MMYASSGTCLAVWEFAAHAASSESAAFSFRASTTVDGGPSEGGRSAPPLPPPPLPPPPEGAPASMPVGLGCEETDANLQPTHANARPVAAAAHTNVAKLLFDMPNPLRCRPYRRRC